MFYVWFPYPKKGTIPNHQKGSLILRNLPHAWLVFLPPNWIWFSCCFPLNQPPKGPSKKTPCRPFGGHESWYPYSNLSTGPRNNSCPSSSSARPGAIEAAHREGPPGFARGLLQSAQPAPRDGEARQIGRAEQMARRKADGAGRSSGFRYQNM